MATHEKGQETVLEQYREYLRWLARLQVDRRFQAKIDLSGLVQQTLLEAYRGLPRFRAKSQQEMAAWLRRILANNLADEIRKFTTGKRDIGRERSLEEALEESSSRLGTWLEAEGSSPSQKAQRHEQALLVAKAMADLPKAQREALELQHWHGWPLAAIAEHMGRSRAAVAGLIKRGLAQLRKSMSDER